MAVKTRVPFWVLNIIRHQGTQKGTIILTTTLMDPTACMLNCRIGLLEVAKTFVLKIVIGFMAFHDCREATFFLFGEAGSTGFAGSSLKKPNPTSASKSGAACFEGCGLDLSDSKVC